MQEALTSTVKVQNARILSLLPKKASHPYGSQWHSTYRGGKGRNEGRNVKNSTQKLRDMLSLGNWVLHSESGSANFHKGPESKYKRTGWCSKTPVFMNSDIWTSHHFHVIQYFFIPTPHPQLLENVKSFLSSQAAQMQVASEMWHVSHSLPTPTLN